MWVGGHLAETLAAARDRGVAHGALTPDTVGAWPTFDEVWNYPRVCDWGLAAAVEGRCDDRETGAVADSSREGPRRE